MIATPVRNPDIELGFERWFIEAWESMSSVRRAQHGCGQPSKNTYVIYVRVSFQSHDSTLLTWAVRRNHYTTICESPYYLQLSIHRCRKYPIRADHLGSNRLRKL